MVRSAIFVCALILVVHLISEPVHANWFGKRGDKEDLFSIFLQQPQDSMIASQEWDAESALLAIESIIRVWKHQQTSDKLAKSRQG
ncbi:hypothetical protein BsWGS_27020 [Bradybaena similaris]